MDLGVSTPLLYLSWYFLWFQVHTGDLGVQIKESELHLL